MSFFYVYFIAIGCLSLVDYTKTQTINTYSTPTESLVPSWPMQLYNLPDDGTKRGKKDCQLFASLSIPSSLSPFEEEQMIWKPTTEIIYHQFYLYELYLLYCVIIVHTCICTLILFELYRIYFKLLVLLFSLSKSVCRYLYARAYFSYSVYRFDSIRFGPIRSDNNSAMCLLFVLLSL